MKSWLNQGGELKSHQVSAVQYHPLLEARQLHTWFYRTTCIEVKVEPPSSLHYTGFSIPFLYLQDVLPLIQFKGGFLLYFLFICPKDNGVIFSLFGPYPNPNFNSITFSLHVCYFFNTSISRNLGFFFFKKLTIVLLSKECV